CVGNLLDQGVLEDVDGLLAARPFVEQLLARQLSQRMLGPGRIAPDLREDLAGGLRPNTEAISSNRRASSGSRLIRARSTSWIVSGAARVAPISSCSAASRASSSRKNGLPSAFARMLRATASEAFSGGKRAVTTLRLSCAE